MVITIIYSNNSFGMKDNKILTQKGFTNTQCMFLLSLSFDVIT